MRLKSFTAKTMTEAMQMVRETLGENAIIVATREENGGKSVRLTAAIEPAFEIGQGVTTSAEDWLQYDDEDEDFAVAEELTEVLLRHAVPENVMDQILSCATVIGLENAHIALIASLEHLFHFRPLPVTGHKKAIMMVGSPGSGKTLAVAKMAARGVMNGLKVGVISTDVVRAGGLEQLASFTKLLQIDLKRAQNADELNAVMQGFRGYDQVLIDTAGVNPFGREDLKHLARLMASGDIEPLLVLPGGFDAEESGEIGRAFAGIGVHTMLPTRLDMARRLGGLLSAAHHGNLAFADASHTAKVADGLMSITPQSLATLLMPVVMPLAHQDQSTQQKKSGLRQ